MYNKIMSQSTDLISNMACFASAVFVTHSVSFSSCSQFLLFTSIDGFSTSTEHELPPPRLCVAHAKVAQLFVSARVRTMGKSPAGAQWTQEGKKEKRAKRQGERENSISWPRFASNYLLFWALNKISLLV